MMGNIDQLGALIARMTMVDLAPRLERGIPRWPTHPHLIIDPTMTHAHDGYFCQSLSMAEHTACHVDAPLHALPDAVEGTVDRLPIDSLIGPAVKYDFGALGLSPGDRVGVDRFLECEQRTGERVGKGEIALLDFGWLRRYWRTDHRAQWYAMNSPGLTEAAALFLSERQIKAVGCDTIACEIALIDGKGTAAHGHETYFLPNGILIVECLANLERLPARSFVAAMPLPIAGGSGSPVRPIALF